MCTRHEVPSQSVVEQRADGSAGCRTGRCTSPHEHLRRRGEDGEEGKKGGGEDNDSG